jgi:hypothetical protein
MLDFLKNLKMDTENILNFLETINDEKANKKRLADDWTILECMEHVFITEKGIYKLLNSSDLFGNQPSKKIENMESYRSGKFKAPDMTLPRGRFQSVDELRNAFLLLREQMGQYILLELPKAGEETYSHPVIGPITKPQWIEFALEHSQRHLLQMEKVLRQAS